MKSIKEKAKKHAEFLSDSLKMESPLYRARMYSFEAGANYVLEQFENLLKDKNTGLVEMWDESMTLIEELRK